MPISDLIAGHERYQQEFAIHQDRLSQLAHGQAPTVLWIGCSDSRVIPERIVDAQPGELFVLREIANVVPPFGVANDTVGAVIEFATLHLPVRDIVVCGHTDCGGIRALEQTLNHAREPHLARWVEWVRPAHAEMQASPSDEANRFLPAIRANAILQCRNLLTYPSVRERVARGELHTHAWVYDVGTGRLQAYDDKSRGWGELG